MSVDRRGVLALGAAAAIVGSAGPAAACSIAVPPGDTGARQLTAIFELMRHWFARDESQFLAMFEAGQLVTPNGRVSSAEWLAGDGRSVVEAFATLFTEAGRYREIQAITIVDGRAFISVREHSEQGLGPDCSGAPVSIELLIDFDDASPIAIHALPGRNGFPIGQVTHWTGAA